MQKATLILPVMALVLFLAGCGGGGSADTLAVSDAVLKDILAKRFDNFDRLMDSKYLDQRGMQRVRDWEIAEGYRTWADFRKDLEGDEGMDPRNESGIKSEDDWKKMSMGKAFGLMLGLYRLHAVDDLDKRLSAPWHLDSGSETLRVEGQGEARITYSNGYNDRITVTCTRRDGLWYLAGIETRFNKELRKKPTASE